MNKLLAHSFHIPVMGIGFTIDTPIKVAKYGITSVISLVDDILIEKMRESYSIKLNIPFKAISDKDDDCRAKRITAFLNLVDVIVKNECDELKKSVSDKNGALRKYMDMLPDSSSLKQEFNRVSQNSTEEELQKWIQNNLFTGSIDVNIMTKLDKENYNDKNEKLPVEYNDAHAALRGFANSTLRSSIVLSAGLNPRLYSYIEKFEDFYPDMHGAIKKKIILKVSDYRSALIQGKFLAKKGLWVSEYRIESGLNCGGHAFATDGYLMGPILDEFKKNRGDLIRTMHDIFIQALKTKNRPAQPLPLPVKFTAQGGVGTAQEHQFLLDYYELDSVGWGTPFLLVPEVTNVDRRTIKLLRRAKEKDLYLSDISPIGIPFNSLRRNTKDVEKRLNIKRGTPGSVCTKKFLVSCMDFTEKAICTASRQYQTWKLKELGKKTLSPEKYKTEYNKIVDKSCICVGLGTSALLVNKLNAKGEAKGVSVCPGPNLAYFTRTVSLQDMVDHIYGRKNIIPRKDRPHMFINELKMYIDFLITTIEETVKPITERKMEQLLLFQNNLREGIVYYQDLFSNVKSAFEDIRTNIIKDLETLNTVLSSITVAAA